MATAAQIRSQVEAVLANRIPSALTPKTVEFQESIVCGFGEIDRLQAFPRGALIELCGPASSGRTSLLQGLLANVTTAGEAAAILDASESFDPVTAKQNGVVLRNLLWIRPGPVRTHKRAKLGVLDQMLIAAEYILQGGGFGLVILDFANISTQELMKIPPTNWFKMLRSVEKTRTALVHTTQLPIAGSSASVTVQLEPADVRLLHAKNDRGSSLYVEGSCVIDSIGIRAEITRARQRKPPQPASRIANFATAIQGYR